MPDYDIEVIRPVSRPISLGYVIIEPPAPDDTAPTVSAITPAPGTALGPFRPISFLVTDNIAMRSVIVWAKFSTRSEADWIYNGTRFHADFAAHSTRAVDGTFSIRHNRAWPGAIEYLWISAIDMSGNLEGGVLPP